MEDLMAMPPMRVHRISRLTAATVEKPTTERLTISAMGDRSGLREEGAAPKVFWKARLFACNRHDLAPGMDTVAQLANMTTPGPLH